MKLIAVVGVLTAVILVLADLGVTHIRRKLGVRNKEIGYIDDIPIFC